MNCSFCGYGMNNLFLSVYQCGECRHVSDYTSIPNASDYSEDKRKNRCDYRKVEPSDVLRMQSRWDMVLRHVTTGRLLDYGCADNVFIECAPKSHGFLELVGFDTNWMTGKSDERILDQEYDVLTMWHVMEHILNPRMVLDRIKHKYLFIVIPWVENMTMDDLPKLNIFNPGRHINLYSRESLMSVLKDYEILEENYDDSRFINMGTHIVGFALIRKDKDGHNSERSENEEDSKVLRVRSNNGREGT